MKYNRTQALCLGAAPPSRGELHPESEVHILCDVHEAALGWHSSKLAQAYELPYIAAMNAGFTLSESAAARVAHLLASEPAGSHLRIAVDGGGCSGFQYAFTFVSSPPASDDRIFGTPQAPVMIDELSLGFIEGAMLDYVETLGASAFEIKNPKAKSSCGCGNSFSVAL